MNTRSFLTRPSRKPERLLLDGDVDPELLGYLLAVGFDAQLAPRDNSPVIRDDVELLRFARSRRRILVCHDQHRDRTTQLRLYPEIYNRGGKIITIGGDSSQHHLLALGKVLIHYAEWSNWFVENPRGGKVVLHKEKWRHTSSDDMMRMHLHHRYRGLDTPELPPRRPRSGRPSHNPPTEQFRLLLE